MSEPARRHEGETYLEIVWRQFRKNTPAYIALWLLAPVFLIAIFAPLIASDRPLVFSDGERSIYPWLYSFFTPEEFVDFLFNMSLLAFFPSVLAGIVLNWRMRRQEIPGPQRSLAIAGVFIGLTVLLVALFSLPGLRFKNPYGARTFPEEQFRSSTASAWYVPIPFGPTEPDIDVGYKPPWFRKPQDLWKESNDGFLHVLGTDSNGRDVLTQMIYGTRISMTVGFVAVSLYITIGVIVGAIAGYSGGFVDIAISRIIEIVLLFPSFFLILTLVALLGPSIFIIMFVIGITGWPTIARLTRGEVLKQRAIDYVQAARAIGASHWRIVFRHILPNSLSPALVAAPFGIAGAIITEAGLSLLGFGVQPPAPSWGTLLRQGNGNYSYWWLVLVPSVAIFVCVTLFNLVGNGLRDAMDPRLRI
jgi:peptide/nickel transport system permease protein